MEREREIGQYKTTRHLKSFVCPGFSLANLGHLMEPLPVLKGAAPQTPWGKTEAP